MDKGAKLARVGVVLYQSGAAFSQLCVVISQVSLAVSQSSLVVSQSSVTLGQFILAFSQISNSVSQYVFLANQLSSLILQFSAVLKKLSEGISAFSKEVQRFSVVMVQFSVAFRHTSITLAYFGRACGVFVLSLRSGRKIPWMSICVVVRQCSEAVCGLGVALGEFSAILSIFTTLNSQLCRVIYLQMMSKTTCGMILSLAKKIRQMSIGVAQLSRAIYQLSLTCAHVTLVGQQWSVVQNLLPGSTDTVVRVTTSPIYLLRQTVNCLVIYFHWGAVRLGTIFIIQIMKFSEFIVASVQNLVEKIKCYVECRFSKEKKSALTLASNLDIAVPVILSCSVYVDKYSCVIFRKELFRFHDSLFRKKKRKSRNTPRQIDTVYINVFIDSVVYSCRIKSISPSFGTLEMNFTNAILNVIENVFVLSSQTCVEMCPLFDQNEGYSLDVPLKKMLKLNEPVEVLTVDFMSSYEYNCPECHCNCFV
ncbi:hypothetical protein J6590_040213 [Homalodisca vitripennis]|nr:hypothetical protein J6590_040213 [Homalodisca vitripennis]